MKQKEFEEYGAIRKPKPDPARADMTDDEKVWARVNSNFMDLEEAFELEKQEKLKKNDTPIVSPRNLIDAELVETALKKDRSAFVTLPVGGLVQIEAVSDITGHFDIGKAELTSPLETTYLGSGRIHPPNRAPVVTGVFSLDLKRYSFPKGIPLLEIFLKKYTNGTRPTEEYPELVDTIHLIALLSHYPDIQNPRGPRFG